MPTSAPVERPDEALVVVVEFEDSEGEGGPVEAVPDVPDVDGAIRDGVWDALAEEVEVVEGDVENRERSLCWFITVIGWPHSVPGPTDALAVATDPDRLRTDVELS